VLFLDDFSFYNNKNFIIMKMREITTTTLKNNNFKQKVDEPYFVME